MLKEGSILIATFLAFTLCACSTSPTIRTVADFVQPTPADRVTFAGDADYRLSPGIY